MPSVIQSLKYLQKAENQKLARITQFTDQTVFLLAVTLQENMLEFIPRTGEKTILFGASTKVPHSYTFVDICFYGQSIKSWK